MILLLLGVQGIFVWAGPVAIRTAYVEPEYRIVVVV